DIQTPAHSPEMEIETVHTAQHTSEPIENSHQTESPQTETHYDQNMETESVNTILSTGNSIENDTQTRRTYSQAVKGRKTPDTDSESDTDYMQMWTEQLNQNIDEKILESFDLTLWNYQLITEAFQSKKKLQELITYKFKTKPAQQILPYAIESKFRHTDRTFFTTFTRAKRFMPQHQTEYENRFTSALQKYKAEHKITITDKQTRDKIHLKLRQKL
ncbi:7376_t:CDS:1, partial [Paraglomus occultum]